MSLRPRYTNLYTLQNWSTAMTVMLEALVVAKYVLEKLGIPTLVHKLHSGQVNMDWNGCLDMHHISFTWHVYWRWGLYQYSNAGVNDRSARDNVMAWWWHLTSHIFINVKWPTYSSDSQAIQHLLDWLDRVIVVQRQLSNFSAISWREQVNFQLNDDEVSFVLDQHA